jgi:hypothetical protein
VVTSDSGVVLLAGLVIVAFGLWGHGMLCAWWGPSGPLIPNDEVGRQVLTHPERFSMVAAVDLRQPMAAVRELRSR